MSLQLGFVSAILPELSLGNVLEFAAGEGFSCVEVMCWPSGPAERKYAGVTHIDARHFTSAHADEVLSLLDKHRVGLSGLGYYPNPLDPNPKAANRCIQHLKKVIDASALLGLYQVNTFIGRDWTKSIEANWPRFLKTWKPLIQYAGDKSVRIGIENCPMLFTKDEWPGGKNLACSPALWRRMFADIPSDFFGLNYDPSHLVWMQMDPIKPLGEFRRKVFHVHAKDVRVDRDRLNDIGILATPLEYHKPRIPGYGDIQWDLFFSKLMEIGYNGPVCIEVEDDTFGKSLEDRMRALKVARRMLEKYF